MSEITTLGGITIIHLTYKNPTDKDWKIACMPHVTDFKTSAHFPNYLRASHTSMITCQECKKTDVFNKVKATER